ncbi:unnamed protein product [Lactuca virosa]|uniref:Non-haem dioxygenase N-terminal domain-containing protein n=1 Tax=Lactuca virosa TaxID=75947 RepID=A0AAU9LY80_9ASTR|nr:unnamed protein product [Lactuca virosa]
MPTPAIPTVDLSPFFTAGDDESGLKKCKDLIAEACGDYGFFQIVNHGVPLDLMNQAMELSKAFFRYLDEVKRECSSSPDSPLPAGYNKQPDHSPDKNEYLLMFPPESPFDVLPTNPPNFSQTTSLLIMVSKRHGRRHRRFRGMQGWGMDSGNPFQGDSGCQLKRCYPEVLSNKKFKSATHRVVRPKGRHRHSYVFFYNLQGDKWVEPLPNFCSAIGVKPKYKGFYYKDYQALRMRNKTHPPSTPKEIIRIAHYEI